MEQDRPQGTIDRGGEIDKATMPTGEPTPEQPGEPSRAGDPPEDLQAHVQARWDQIHAVNGQATDADLSADDAVRQNNQSRDDAAGVLGQSDKGPRASSAAGEKS